MIRNQLSAGVAVGLCLAFAFTAAHAFTEPAASGATYEVPLRQFDLHGYGSDLVTAGRAAVEGALEFKQGGEWHVYSWNPQTQTPHLFYGSGVNVASVGTRNDLIAAARTFVTENRDVFRASLGSARVAHTTEALGKKSVIYQQSYKGIDVWGGRVILTFTDEGRFFSGGSDFYSGITVDSRPSITAAIAEDIALRDLPWNADTDRIEKGSRLLILPVPISETEVEHHLVWKVTVRTEAPLGKWVTHVDAHTGEIVWRFNDIHFANYIGNADGEEEQDTYCNPTNIVPYKYLRVQLSGLGSTNTDQNGNWMMLYGGNDSRTVTADLYGPYVDLNNVSGAEGTFTGNATPGTPLNVHFDPTNSRKDERDTFMAVNDVHDFIAQFDPAFPYINARITANVGVAGTCNAYWDGTINFYNAGGGCANTGEIQGVVHHEFGHGVQASILGWQGDQGLGEGNSDILANLITQESIIGRGFNSGNCVNGIRNSKNTLRYPENVIGIEIHAAGQVIAGFVWDQMEIFQGLYGTQAGTIQAAILWHEGRKLTHPTTQPDQVYSAFVADDNDGNLSNGTPHYDAICQAAANHGFSCPTLTSGLFITHTPIETMTTEGDVAIQATITTTSGAIIPESTYVAYRLSGGPFAKAQMTTGGLNLWTGILPALTQPSEVEYYIHSSSTTGFNKTSPSVAPLYTYPFDIALVYDKQEAANGWVVNPDANDNATTGIWTRVDPNGTIAQPENDHSPSGTICWVTGQGGVGGGDGDQDVDNGKTTLQTVGYDLTGAFSASLKYFRWYSNDQGATPGTDTWKVQIRNNGGAWQDVENTMTSSNAWEAVSVDALALFGGALGTVELRFIAEDAGAGSLIEGGIDDLEILADMDGSADVHDPNPTAPARFALFGAAPNPTRAGATIGYELPRDTQVRISIYDVGGREVRTVVNGPLSAGHHVATWDGRDDAGRRVASGLYFYKMRSPGFTATRSLVLTH